jgi:hypothetical protein
MDSTQTSFISVIKDFFSIILSIVAVIISLIALNRTKRISIPKITGRYNHSDKFILHVEDYSTSKNLRIDEVYFKPLDKYGYFKIDFGSKILAEQTPLVVQVLLKIRYGGRQERLK